MTHRRSVIASMMIAMIALFCIVFPGESPAQDAAYETFLAAVSAGADCLQLFEPPPRGETVCVPSN
jgi:hypothetical protein